MARRLLSLVLVLTVLVLQAAPCLAFQTAPAPKRAVPAIFAPESFPINSSDPSGLQEQGLGGWSVENAQRFHDVADAALIGMGVLLTVYPPSTLAGDALLTARFGGAGMAAYGSASMGSRRLAGMQEPPDFSVLFRQGGGSAARAAGAANLRKLGLENTTLYGKSYNAGRKLLERAGFKLSEVTKTGRKVFDNLKTGAKVIWDGTPRALEAWQKPHWHIEYGGNRFTRSGRPVPRGEDAAHIPGR